MLLVLVTVLLRSCSAVTQTRQVDHLVVERFRSRVKAQTHSISVTAMLRRIKSTLFSEINESL